MQRGVTAVLHCVLAAICSLLPGAAMAKPDEIQIAILAHTLRSDDKQLREALEATDAARFAFVLVNGIKLAGEPCNDALYLQRQALLDNARNSVIVSLAATDWAACMTTQNKPAAIERLNRLRELFFDLENTSESALENASNQPRRQSESTKFRNYVENARWEIRGILFATVNLPADNNHYLAEAGRNSEFEDRQIATAEWLERIVRSATGNKVATIVLFSDANPFAAVDPQPLFGSAYRRDGFREVRRKLVALAATYRGKILLVHGQPNEPGTAAGKILWQKNIGTLAAGSGNASTWMKLTLSPGAANPFRVKNEALAAEKQRGK